METTIDQINMKNKTRCGHEEGEYHDCEYVDSVDLIVDVAVDLTNSNISKNGDRKEYNNEWDKEFHKTMRRLTVEKGLR